jgi:hypothetical protein
MIRRLPPSSHRGIPPADTPDFRPGWAPHRPRTGHSPGGLGAESRGGSARGCPGANTLAIRQGLDREVFAERGPLLILDGENDNTVPWAVANATYKRQQRNEGVTEIVKMPNRGHALTIDSGWRAVADTALNFVTRFVRP